MGGVSLLYTMVDIPEALAHAIQAGDCVLCLGAALGAAAGRPRWGTLLEQAIQDCDEDARDALRDLLEQRRFATVADYVRRHAGADALRQAAEEAARAHPFDPTDESLEALRRLPWRACWTSLYPDLATHVLRGTTRAPDVLTLDGLQPMSLQGREPFVLDLPLRGAALRGHMVLRDVVEEAFRSRTLLWLGFHPDDPDFVQMLAVVEALGRGNEHYALLPGLSAPEIEQFEERYGIHVLEIGEDDALKHVIAQLGAACQRVPEASSNAESQLAVLDLVRAVGHLGGRADRAADEALCIDGARVAALLERLEARLGAVPHPVTVAAGHVMLFHDHLDLARRCYAYVAEHARDESWARCARFDLALVDLAEGDRTAASEALRELALVQSDLAFVPPPYELVSVEGRSGAQFFLRCLDRSSGKEVDVVASTLARPVGIDEQIGFKAAVKQLAKVQHPGVCRAVGGFAHGRMIGVAYEATPGFVLAESIADGALPMSFAKAWELLEPLLGGLRECHGRNVLHRNINPDNVVVGAAGAKLRGFGFPPVVGFMRPSVRAANQGYLAPEVRDGGGERPASDVYAIAALAYRLLSGKIPQGSVPLLDIENEDLDPRVDPLLRRALHPDPAQRLELATLIEGLSEIAAEQDGGVLLREADAPIPIERSADRSSGRHSTLKYALPDDRDDLDAWAWILEHKSTHLEARQNVDRIEREARATQRWDRVVEALAVKANVSQVQRERIDILREIARLNETELSAPGNAFSSLEELLAELDTPEQVATIPDFERLAQITGRWGDLSDILEGLAPRVPDEQERAGLLALRGKILAEHLRQSEPALAAYEAALALAPSRETWEAVIPLYRQTDDAAGLARALVSLADLQDGEERIQTLLAAATAFHEQLSDSDGALGAIEIALGEAPRHPDALALAERLTRALGRWDLLVDFLARRAELEDDRTRVLALRKEAAELALLRLSDEPTAIALFQLIVQDDPEDREAWSQLAGLLREGAVFDAKLRPPLVAALQGLLRLTWETDDRAGLVVELIGLLDAEPDGEATALLYRQELLELLPIEREVCREAAVRVEQHYRDTHDSAALEDLLRRQAECEDAEPEFRTAAWSKLLDLYKGPVLDDDKALLALEALSRLEPEEGQWQGQLASRYMERGDYTRAVQILEEQIQSATADGPKAVLLLQAGRVHHKLGNLEQAIDAWERAVDLEPELAEAWRELQAGYEAVGRALPAAQAAIEAARLGEEGARRTETLFDAARRLLDLGQRQTAISVLEDVLDAEPGHETAAVALLEALIQGNELTRAWPLAQRYVERITAQEDAAPEERLKALAWAGRCALAVEDAERARQFIEEAKQLDASNVELLRLLGDLDLRSGRHREALRSFQAVASTVGTTLPPGESAGLHVQMARARMGLGEDAKASQLLERALELDPDHRDAAQLWVEVGTRIGGATELRATEHLLALLTRREAHTDDIEELADIQEARTGLLQAAVRRYREQGDVEACVRALEALAELEPEDQALLHQMLDLYTEHQRWKDATGVLERLAERQTSTSVKAKYLYAAAVIVRDNLKDLSGAAEWLRRVLDVDPEHARAFDARVDVLTKQSAWTELSRMIRGHLKSYSKSLPPQRMVELFETLSRAHVQLEDDKTALAALDQAARLAEKIEEDPERHRERQENVIRRAIQLGEDELDKAVYHGHSIIADAPMEFEMYHRLVEIYLARGEKDNARVISRTLMFLHQADEAEEELADAPFGQPSGTISSELFREGIRHEREDVLVGEVFALVWPMIAVRQGHTLARHGVSPDRRIPVELASPLSFARYVAYGCQIFEAPPPELFMRDQGNGIVLDALAAQRRGQQVMHPCILVGRDIAAEPSEIVLRCRAGRAIANLRPEAVLTAVLPDPQSLATAFWGAVWVARGSEGVPLEHRAVAEDYGRHIVSYLPAAGLDDLKKLLEGSDAFDLQAWRRGAALTINRAGFVLSDSIEVTAQVVSRVGEDGSGLTTKERIADLIGYSVSRDYLDLRRKIGLAG